MYCALAGSSHASYGRDVWLHCGNTEQQQLPLPSDARAKGLASSDFYKGTSTLQAQNARSPEAGELKNGGGSRLQEFAQQLRLQAGDRVLDVGCGIGGGDFLMASRYGACVHGIDLSVNMVLGALERAQQQEASQVWPCGSCVHFTAVCCLLLHHPS